MKKTLKFLHLTVTVLPQRKIMLAAIQTTVLFTVQLQLLNKD